MTASVLLLYIQSVAVSRKDARLGRQTSAALAVRGQEPVAPHGHSYQHVDRSTVPSFGGRAPSSIIASPSDEDLVAARAALTARCAEPEAWDMQWWFANRNASVAAQHDIRNALNTEGQYWLSRLAVPDASKLRPCKRTVVSIATIPSRIARLYNLVSALRHQHVPPDAILIALPPFAPRLKQTYTIPDFLKDDPLVRFVPLPADFGPLSKLAAAIHSEPDPDTCIITVDDDAEPLPWVVATMVTWAGVFPDAALGECGWNTTCLTGRVPHVCGEGNDVYLFVRRDSDHMCRTDSLARYNFHPCLAPVGGGLARPAEVLMGVSNPLYRRGMFGDDFLDIAKIVAKRKIRRMLDAHYRALGTTDAAALAAQLGEDAAQQVRLLSIASAVHSKAARDDKHKEEREKQKLLSGGSDGHAGDAPPAAAAADAAAAVDPDILSPELVKLAQDALAHPDLAETDTLLRWKRANPPDPLFLVDDVYISAYLACKGVPRVVVPVSANAVPPVPFVTRANATPLPPQPPRPAEPSPGAKRNDLSAVDALHGTAMFNQGNHEAVRFFHQEGCW